MNGLLKFRLLVAHHGMELLELCALLILELEFQVVIKGSMDPLAHLVSILIERADMEIPTTSDMNAMLGIVLLTMVNHDLDTEEMEL